MRIERDSMGTMEVPDSALYGAQTQRAALNFPISVLRFSKDFISAIGLIKLAACRANGKLGLLPEKKVQLIENASKEVVDGIHHDQFVVDIFQTGSGTSTNMNVNEVIANRATEIAGGKRGDRGVVHPNDDINMCQSSNDVIPSAIHIAAQLALEGELIPALLRLEGALENRAKEFAEVIKAGRTHLQDATPVTLGQEFSGYAAQVKNGVERIRKAQSSILELPLGGTAVGTGINAHPEFARLVIEEINAITGSRFFEARNHFEAQGGRDAVVELSGQLKTIACSLMKIANDLRWLGAGPRCNLFEVFLPEIQPGSSIMPAKVNPVLCESVMMVAAQVIGNDSTITVCGQHGNFELNVMMPVMAHNLLESIKLLSRVSTVFCERCVNGIQANEPQCKKYAENSLASVTSLAPIIGYDKAAEVAKLAYHENKSVREAALKLGVMGEEELDTALDLMAMTNRLR